MFFDNEKTTGIDRMLNKVTDVKPFYKKVKTTITFNRAVEPEEPKKEEKVNDPKKLADAITDKKKEVKVTHFEDKVADEYIKASEKLNSELEKNLQKSVKADDKASKITIKRIVEAEPIDVDEYCDECVDEYVPEEPKKEEKKQPKEKPKNDDRSIEEKLLEIIKNPGHLTVTEEYDDDDEDEFCPGLYDEDDEKLYDRLREFIEDEFMVAFMWFMKNSYERVSFDHQHKRRVYRIYKEIIGGSNLYGTCIADADSDRGECAFFLNGSDKAITNFNNNKKAKYAKILAKYIIASNTAPYVLELMAYEGNDNCDCYTTVPTICGARNVYKSELYTKVLEKVCFGRHF